MEHTKSPVAAAGVGILISICKQLQAEMTFSASPTLAISPPAALVAIVSVRICLALAPHPLYSAHTHLFRYSISRSTSSLFPFCFAFSPSSLHSLFPSHSPINGVTPVINGTTTSCSPLAPSPLPLSLYKRQPSSLSLPCPSSLPHLTSLSPSQNRPSELVVPGRIVLTPRQALA